MNIKPYLVLIRPANIVTAIADILAGFAIAGLIFYQDSISVNTASIVALIISTIGLYGGGIVFNDYFDADLDKIERPERPIPSGRVSKNSALVLGISLIVIGIASSATVSQVSGLIAIGIVFGALFYDKYAKHSSFFGPLFMGLCRSLNLLLGMSIYFPGLAENWYMAILPLVFIGAITLTSQGEVKGNNKKSLLFAFTLDACILIFLTFLAFYEKVEIYTLIPFLLLWAIMNGKALVKAIRNNTSANIMNAVKTGVISLIPLNASYAAGFGGWIMGLIVLALLPVSLLLSKKFAVT